MIRVVQEHYKNCPYYKNGDEYAVVKKQIKILQIKEQ